jgi:hypothetical protein
VFRVERINELDAEDLPAAAIASITGDSIVSTAIYLLPSMYNHDCGRPPHNFLLRISSLHQWCTQTLCFWNCKALKSGWLLVHGEVLQLASNGSLKKVGHCAICAVSDLFVDPWLTDPNVNILWPNNVTANLVAHQDITGGMYLWFKYQNTKMFFVSKYTTSIVIYMIWSY